MTWSHLTLQVMYPLMIRTINVAIVIVKCTKHTRHAHSLGLTSLADLTAEWLQVPWLHDLLEVGNNKETTTSLVVLEY